MCFENKNNNYYLPFFKKLLVRVECTPSDMLVHLNLAREFRGRVYATGNPQACFELGGGNSEMTLRIPLGTQCGTVQQVNSVLLISWFCFSKFDQKICIKNT